MIPRVNYSTPSYQHIARYQDPIIATPISNAKDPAPQSDSDLLARIQAAEAEIRRLRERQSEFDEVDLFIGRLDLEGRLIDANRASLEQCGFRREDVIGRPFWECGWWNRSPERMAWVREGVENALRGVTVRGETVYFVADGGTRLAEYACRPIRDEDGRIVGAMPTGMDVTDRAWGHQDQRATAILESITDAFFAVGDDWRFRYMNGQAERLLGRSRGDLLGRIIWEEYPGLVGTEFERAFRRAMLDHEPSSVTSHYPDHDAWYDSHAYPSVGGISIYFRDISERVRAQEQLRLLDEQRRLALDSARLGIWQIDPATHELTSDRRLREIYGIEGDAMSFEQALERIHPVDRGRVVAKVRAAQDPDNPIPYSDEHRILLPDGSIRWVYSNGRAHFEGEAPDRRLISFNGTIGDITERKQTEDALRRGEDRYHSLFESIDEGFCVIEVLFDDDGRPDDFVFLETNPVFQKQTGLDDVIGVRMRDIAPDHEAEWFRIYGEVARTGEPVRFKNEARALGRWFDLYAFRVGNPGENQIAVLFKDITETLRAGEEREHLLAELKQADRRKDEFLAMLAHELRNPLAAIQGAARLAADPRMADDLPDALEVIDRQSRNLARLIDDLLDVSRIAQGKLKLQREVVDVPDILNRAARAVRTAVEAKRHELTIRIHPGRLVVHADPTRLEQVVVNLLMNAVKYTEDGGQIDLSAAREGPEVVIRVRDNGVGISPEMLPKVFELFTQVDRSLARSEGGLGIGLTLVRHLVEMHGGSILAESRPGEGSTFVVRVPFHDAPESTGRPRTREAVRGQGRRILIVDDNVDTAGLTGRILKAMGFDIRLAHDGPSALDAAREHKPILILLDIGLPSMSGYEVARALRSGDFPRETVIVAVSGYGDDRSRELGRAAGFDYHMPKPVDVDAVLAFLPRDDE